MNSTTMNSTTMNASNSKNNLEINSYINSIIKIQRFWGKKQRFVCYVCKRKRLNYLKHTQIFDTSMDYIPFNSEFCNECINNFLY